MQLLGKKTKKGDEEKIKENWKKKITGMKAAFENDKKKVDERNQKRRAEFEQRLQETRRFELDDETNRFLISIDSFSMEEGEEADEETSGENNATNNVPSALAEQTASLSEVETDTVTVFSLHNFNLSLRNSINNFPTLPPKIEVFGRIFFDYFGSF